MSDHIRTIAPLPWEVDAACSQIGKRRFGRRLDTSGLEIGWELKREQGRLSRRRRVKLTQIQAEASWPRS